MPKRFSKWTDENQAAKSVVDAIAKLSGETGDEDSSKDPAAVSLGRRGGLKGGKRRLETMTPEQRKEAARKAASARWNKSKPT